MNLKNNHRPRVFPENIPSQKVNAVSRTDDVARIILIATLDETFGAYQPEFLEESPPEQE